MHVPINAEPEKLPTKMEPWLVGAFAGTREELREAFGPPHYIETDGTRTCGGEEDNWAWRLPTGQVVVINLDLNSGAYTAIHRISKRLQPHLD
jgi:hypothetical protein